MSVPATPVRNTPWLAIILGALAVFCLCACVIVVAALAYLIPIRGSTSVTAVAPVEVLETATALPTVVQAEETQENPSAVAPDAAPAGTAVDLGNDMTLTVLDVTRPADDIVESGSVLNATPPEGEEFLRVDVEVSCNSDSGTQCTFYPTVMKAVLGDGSTRDLQIFIEGVDDWDTAVEMEGGATEQGFLLFIVPTAEKDVLLSYQDLSAEPVYLQLP